MSVDIYVNTFYGIILSPEDAMHSVSKVTQDETEAEAILYDKDTELQKKHQLGSLKFFDISDSFDGHEFCVAIPESHQRIDVLEDGDATRKFPRELENTQESLDAMKKLSSQEPQWHMTIRNYV